MEEQNMVIILGRKQLSFKAKNIPIEDVTIDDFWPIMAQAIANADVVIFKDGKRFKVVKHIFMPENAIYHISELKNIAFAR